MTAKAPAPYFSVGTGRDGRFAVVGMRGELRASYVHRERAEVECWRMNAAYELGFYAGSGQTPPAGFLRDVAAAAVIGVFLAMVWYVAANVTVAVELTREV